MATSTPKSSLSTGPEQSVSFTAPPTDIIYHNMHAGSDFRTFRAQEFPPHDSIKSNILQIAKHLEDECYTLISINASRYSMVVVFSNTLSNAELRAKGFPFPIPVVEPTGAIGK